MRCACTQANVYVFVTNPERKLATSFTLGADGGDAKRTVSGKPFGLYGRFNTPYSGRLEALRELEAPGRDEN